MIRLFSISIWALLFASTACGNQAKETSPALSGEQELICNLIVKMYGHPKESFGVMDENNGQTYYYTDEFVEKHCTSELRQELRDRYVEEWAMEGDPNPKGYFTEEFFGIWDDGLCSHSAAEFIIVANDRYSYFFYDKGKVGYNRIRAHVEGETAIIDEANKTRVVDGSSNWHDEDEKWIRAGWYGKTGDDELFIFSLYSCVIVNLSLGEPSWQNCEYSLNGDQVTISLPEGKELTFKKTSDSEMKSADGAKTLNKIVGEPVIIVEK